MAPKEELAIELANATIKQLGQEGYVGALEGHIRNSIIDSKIDSSSLKMQFKLPKGLQYQQDIIHSDGTRAILFPRRVLTTTQTAYQRSAPMKYLVKLEEAFSLDKLRGYDSQLVCRHFRSREPTKTILSNLEKRGVDYVLMCTLTTDLTLRLTDPEGRTAHDEKGNYMRQRNPIFILPKATPEEIETANKFCQHYQIPSQKSLDRLTGQTD